MRGGFVGDLLSVEPDATVNAANVITIARGVAGVSSVLGWLRAQPRGNKKLRDGVACFEDTIELRHASESIELVVTLQRRAVDDNFDRARRRAISSLMRMACCEMPAPSRLPRPAAVLRNAANNDLTVEWQVDADELEEIGWALVAKVEKLAGVTKVQDASIDEIGSFRCIFCCGTQIRLDYENAEGKVKLVTSACSDHFQPLLDQIVDEACLVPVIERQAWIMISAAVNNSSSGNRRLVQRGLLRL